MMTQTGVAEGWTRLDPDHLPPKGVLLDVITRSADERQLIFEKGLFWLPDRTMYVYFVPESWRIA